MKTRPVGTRQTRDLLRGTFPLCESPIRGRATCGISAGEAVGWSCDDNVRACVRHRCTNAIGLVCCSYSHVLSACPDVTVTVKCTTGERLCAPPKYSRLGFAMGNIPNFVVSEWNRADCLLRMIPETAILRYYRTSDCSKFHLSVFLSQGIRGVTRFLPLVQCNGGKQDPNLEYDCIDKAGYALLDVLIKMAVKQFCILQR